MQSHHIILVKIRKFNVAVPSLFLEMSILGISASSTTTHQLQLSSGLKPSGQSDGMQQALQGSHWCQHSVRKGFVEQFCFDFNCIRAVTHLRT